MAAVEAGKGVVAGEDAVPGRQDRGIGTERVDALLEVGSPITVKVHGRARQVTVDQVARVAISIVAIGTLWVTAI